MRIIITIILALAVFTSCGNDDDSDCTCQGRFTNDGGQTFFFGNSVDCDTGAPTSETNPQATYLGCND